MRLCRVRDLAVSLCIAWGAMACSKRVDPSTMERASAKVLATSGGKCNWLPDQGDLCPDVEVEVRRAGQAPYRTTFAVRLPTMQAVRIQPGVTLTVLVAPEDPRHVELAADGLWGDADAGAS